MRILVTGGKGFVGSATIKYINSLKDEKGNQLHTCESFDIMDRQDIRNLEGLDRVCESFQPDRILHLAAIARFGDADKDPKLAFETNVRGTMNVMACAMKYSTPVVYASTGSVYMPIDNYEGTIKEDWRAVGNSVYGCSKYIGETYVRTHTPHIILRYAHLYGKEKRMHGLIGGFLDRINRGLVPTLYGGKQSNDFTYINDVARANWLALSAPWDKWNQVYNIGTGEELSAEQAGKLVCEIAGWTGGTEVKEQRGVDPQRFAFDCSKAEVMLGFKAEYDFKAGLADMFADGSIKNMKPPVSASTC